MDYELIRKLGSIVSFIANLVVVRVCFAAYARTRIRPLLLLGVSGALALFALVIDAALMANLKDPEAFNILWVGLELLWAVDMVLYAVGTYGLVTHVLRERRESE